MNSSFTIKYSGDSALDICFEEKISPEINSLVKYYTTCIREKKINGIIDIIPAYCTIQVVFNPLVISAEKIKRKILKIKAPDELNSGENARIIHIPVCYEGEFAPDIENVVKNSGLSETDVISLHSSKSYLIYMLGFLPGFPYLGGLDERLHTPRLQTPRTRIEPGSVGIGGKQTGIYPVASPGGWQIIGRTPVKVYDKNKENPILYRAGDKIKFDPITEGEFHKIKSDNTYECKWENNEK